MQPWINVMAPTLKELLRASAQSKIAARQLIELLADVVIFLSSNQAPEKLVRNIAPRHFTPEKLRRSVYRQRLRSNINQAARWEMERIINP